MTDPLHDRLRAAVQADALPVPLGDLHARAQKRRFTLIATPVLAVALVVGTGAALLNDGDTSASQDEQVIATLPPTEEPSASPTPAVTTPTPSAVPTTTAIPTRSPSAGPTRSPGASSTALTSTVPPASPEPPASEAGDLARVAVSVSPALAAPGDRVIVTVTLTNTNDEQLRLATSTTCGEAFGSISVRGTRLSFGPGSDVCYGGPKTLAPAASAVLSGVTEVPLNVSAGTFKVVAEARFRLSTGPAATDYTVIGESSLRLLDRDAGTRTFAFENDFPYRVDVGCGGCGGGMFGNPVVEMGTSMTFTASILGPVYVTRVLSRGEVGERTQTCFDPKTIPQGSTGRIILSSETTACPTA